MNNFKKSFFFLILLILPVAITGCFKKANNQPSSQPEITYSVYAQEAIPNGGYKVKYPANWTVEEATTDKFADFKDIAIFKSPEGEENKVVIFKPEEKEAALNSYKIESQSQTQIASRLADDYLVLNESGGRLRIIAVASGNYLYFLVSNKPGSGFYDNFINSFSFTEYEATSGEQGNQDNLSKQLKLKLYFDDLRKENAECSAEAVQEVIVDRPELEIGLIPLAIKALIQSSNPDDLANKNLASAISINTRLRSFGYENNTAIVNFNDEFSASGSSCEMEMRRNQVQETLKALNNVSNLEIKKVEFQVEGQPITETEQ